MRTLSSKELYAQACEVLPGGVNSPVRAMRSIGRDPIFIARGEGGEVVDVDGNRYIDYVSSWGALIHGHAHPAVVTAVEQAACKGTSFGMPTPGEVELASEIVARVPSVEMVRLTSSGTEATLAAIRLARAVTGRTKLLKFAGSYHGSVDDLLAQAGSGLATFGIPASPGVLPTATEATVVIPWNDRAALTQALAAHDFAAVLAEPYPANMGLVPPDDGFLELLRSGATQNGALLIFDEVITGFRVAKGGAQERTGVMPDLTIMGKVVGGGLPVGAVGGSRELMEQLAPVGDVYQAGTLSGNPLAVAAGLAALRELDQAAYLELARITEQLAEGLRAAAGDLPIQVTSAPGLLTVFFTAQCPKDYEAVKTCDFAAHAAWCRELLARGIYPPPSQFEAWFPSLAHSEEQIERTVSLAGEAFAAIRVPAHA